MTCRSEVDEWFVRWRTWFVESIPRGDWPTPEAAFWTEVRRLMISSGATASIATAAGRKLFDDPPNFVQDVPKTLKAALAAAWREHNAKSQPRPLDSSAEERAASSAEFDRAAFETWSHLDETEREVWRRLARQRIPMFRGESSELLAIAWAHDPASIIPPPPPRDVPKPTDRRGPRRLFEPIEKV